MIRKFFIPILAIVGVVGAIVMVVRGNRPPPVSQPVAEPARAPFEHYIAGAGIVEAKTENIAVGTVVSGVVTKVCVKVHDFVHAGDPLFQLDDRDQQAELEGRQALLASAEAKKDKVTRSHRPEDVPVYEARLAAAKAGLADANAQWNLYKEIADPRAVSRDDRNKREFAVQLQEANVRLAQADLDELNAGAWEPDSNAAAADLRYAQAQVKSTETEIQRRIVRAQVDGEILQVNVRPGEYAIAGANATPLMLLGDTRTLHVRVDVDENDAWRFDPAKHAVGKVRGNPNFKTDLTFVRTEPYVLPKKSLTGDSTERVDTRVLQVLYSFANGALPVYVGQQLDVFIEAAPVDGSTTQGAAR